ncbi:MAG: chalcone isomerase family protein [Thalassolituus sp.]|jgi:hypothetical protein|nr:MAG: chalcone isomerase [Oceanobacter sp.]|tara:strand:- start:939 stop:1502 length:564 start_codon:yes stop_codon:yes gene_type:complete
MIRFILSVVFLITSISVVHAATKIDGVKLPDDLSFEASELVLNGAGVRSKFFVHVYIAALYLGEKSSDAETIIAADEPMNIRVVITSDLITGERFAESAMDGFVRSTHGDLSGIKSEVDVMIETFRSSLENGDVFDLNYVPDVGVEIYRNGEKKEVVPGLAFKQAMFGIWLSDDPVQGHLRDDMLSK